MLDPQVFFDRAAGGLEVLPGGGLVAALACGFAFQLAHDANVLRDLWLLPLRDVLALAIWIWSYADDTVIWRGEKFRLEKGRMYAVAANSSDTAAKRCPSA